MVLVVAACGGGESANTSTTESLETTTTTAAPEAVKLSYKLEPGTSFEFEVAIDQHLKMTAEGSGAALGGEELPGELMADLTGTSTFTYSVAEGPDEGTYEVTITGDFSDLEITGTIDGEPLDLAELPDFASLEPVDVSVVVDEEGNVIPQDDEFGDLFGRMGDLGNFGDFATHGTGPGRFVGPPFSDGEVTVGDSWTETFETPGLLDGEGITTVVTSEVTGTDNVAGSEVFVIETTSVTSPIEFDLAQLLIGFFTALVPEDATDEKKAEIEALKLLFSIDETTSNLTTWFDSAEGVARKAEYTSDVHLAMDLNVPDEESGEMDGVIVDLSIDQMVTYQLLGSSSS